MFGKSQEVQPDFEYFTLFDTKVGIYREPMLAINRHDILRQLTTLFLDPAQAQNPLLINAEDYQVFKIGTFTKRTGEIGSQQPEHIANLHELRSAVQRKQQAESKPTLVK